MPAYNLHGSTDTLPMDVRNTGFLLDRLGEDCHPIQYLRELTTNAIEAIQKTPDKTGEIIWDVDWTTFQNEGLYKLSILDTGVGMTAEEMERYINNLSSSGDQQTITGNYGVGAKISAATRNHSGVIYASWKNGEGSLIHLWRNPETGTYGLRRFASPTGQYTYSIGLANDVRPDPIRDHGTKVVLLGNDPKQNTVAPPRQDIPSPSRWVSKYRTLGTSNFQRT